jgi:hypothetical protein
LREHFRVTFAEGGLLLNLMREDDDRVLPIRDLGAVELFLKFDAGALSLLDCISSSS